MQGFPIGTFLFWELNDRKAISDFVFYKFIEEYKENEDLPNTTNPDDWAKISGRKGERIVNIRALIENESDHQKREPHAIKGGAYL